MEVEDAGEGGSEVRALSVTAGPPPVTSKLEDDDDARIRRLVSRRVLPWLVAVSLRGHAMSSSPTTLFLSKKNNNKYYSHPLSD